MISRCQVDDVPLDSELLEVDNETDLASSVTREPLQTIEAE
jgi:hypothetical protein